MVSTMAIAHNSINPFSSLTSTRSLPPNLTSTTRNFSQVRCALHPQKWRESRRVISISFVLMHCLTIPKQSMASGALDNYVKRKRLDPLEAYVPAVILTQFQLKDLEKILDVDQPQFAAYRSLLRSGPAASLRVNIRAVAQYASDSGNGKTASDNVDQCISALEDLDSLFLRASRNDSGASVQSMRTKIGLVVNALDSLLQTVPTGVLDKGKAIADAYRTQEDAEPEITDPEMRRLESIL